MIGTGAISHKHAQAYKNIGFELTVCTDINEAGAAQTVSRIEESGATALAVGVDVADPESVQALARATVRAFGAVHVLVNNAAIQVSKRVEDTTFEEWNRQMAVNVGGVFLCSKYFLPHLRQTRGAIVNLSSVNGYFVEPMCAGYCATWPRAVSSRRTLVDSIGTIVTATTRETIRL